MRESEIRDIMAGGGGAYGKLVRPGLWLASRVYGDLTAWRRFNYRHKWTQSFTVDVPVVSVGNLTTGGTGKTPMVMWVVRELQAMGARPAIVTRGYKAREGKSDEAEMLSNSCNCPVIVNADRVAGAKTAIIAGANVVVLDDGFQHLRLRRDLNIVLIDATNPFGYGHVLPRGMMRERPRALKDAHLVVITRCDQVAPEEIRRIRRRINRVARGVDICRAVHRPRALVDHQGIEIDPLELAGKRVVGFCGVGNPESFFTTLRDSDAELTGRLAYDDHAEYTDQTVEQVNQLANDTDAEWLVTTEKDAVKLAGLNFEKPLWQLQVQMHLTEGAFTLRSQLNDLMQPTLCETDETD
jgi:tetraacyldisaccharide 4'-kinase